MNRLFFRTLATLLCSITALTFLSAREASPTVAYLPRTQNIEGDQPLSFTYDLTITSPSNVVADVDTVITPELYVISAPEGVDDATALSYVTLTSDTLTFNQPAQNQNLRIVCEYPLGTVAGAYAYGIRTNGWASGTVDGNAFINSQVYPVASDLLPPTVKLLAPITGTTYTYYPATGTPVQVPVNFEAYAALNNPITGVEVSVNGSVQNVSVTGIGTDKATAKTTLTITQAGLYTVLGKGQNATGSATDSADFTVNVVAPPPTANISSPAAGAIYTRQPNVPAQVQFNLSGSSIYGGITSLVATLDGAPVTFSPVGLNTLTATGSVTLSVSTDGTHVLSVVATNAYGTSTPVTRSFVVVTDQPPVISAPPPTVVINSPANGTIISRVAGSGPTSVPFTFTASTTSGWTISSIGASLGSTSLTVTPNGLNTATATGTGTMSIANAGTYTLTARGTSGTTTANTSVTFTIVETAPPPPPCPVTWLGTLASGTVSKGGSQVSVSFEINCAPKIVQGSNYIVKFVSAVYSASSNSTVFTYSVTSNPNGGYAISHWGIAIPASLGGAELFVSSSDKTCSFVNPDPTTGLRGFKFDTGYKDKEVRTVTLTLRGQWTTDTTSITVKSSTGFLTGNVRGPARIVPAGSIAGDNTLVVAVYEIFSNGSTSTPKLYRYVSGSSSSVGYTIQGDVYALNFLTGSGCRKYQVEVYRPTATGTQLLGSKQFTTK